MDALAYESHFIAHLAPVWRALPEQLRGTFWTEPSLVGYAASLGIEASGQRVDLRLPARPGEEVHRALVASYGDIKRGRKMGYGAFAFLEHGIGQAYIGVTHGSYAGGTDREDVELFLMPNEYAASRWRDAYPAASVQVIGCPKLDSLPARQPGPGPVVAIAFHWACHIVPETMPAWHHFRVALPALAKRFTLIGHAHPRVFLELARHYRRMGVQAIADFDEVCRRADVLIADNTSALYEFAATGRPVVVLNPPFYRRDVHHGLRFWTAATVGLQVEEPDALIPAVEEALADAPVLQAAREAALALVYSHRSGAAQRAAAALSAWMADVPREMAVA